jgi:hypothetical protein
MRWMKITTIAHESTCMNTHLVLGSCILAQHTVNTLVAAQPSESMKGYMALPQTTSFMRSHEKEVTVGSMVHILVKLVTMTKMIPGQNHVR